MRESNPGAAIAAVLFFFADWNVRLGIGKHKRPGHSCTLIFMLPSNASTGTHIKKPIPASEKSLHPQCVTVPR